MNSGKDSWATNKVMSLSPECASTKSTLYGSDDYLVVVRNKATAQCTRSPTSISRLTGASDAAVS